MNLYFLPILWLQVCYAKELKEGFVEYTEQVVKLMVPLLKFYFHDDILQPLNTKRVDLVKLFLGVLDSVH